MQSFESVKIGNRIKEIRMAQGLTQEKLAEKIGKSIGLVGQIERAETMPSLDTLIDIICILGVSADSVLCDVIPNRQSAQVQILQLLAALDEREQAYVVEMVANFKTFLSAGKL